MFRLPCILVLFGIVAAALALAVEPVEQADVERQAATALLEQYCLECHGPDVQEGNLRFDQFGPIEEHAGASATTEKMLRALRELKMPPEDAETLPQQNREKLIAWLERQLRQWDESSIQQGALDGNRRLTIEEYNYTLQALFGVDATFNDQLPADPISEHGYRNATERLGLSSLQLEAYLDSARRAVGRYVQFGPLEQQPLRYFIELEDLYYSTAERYQSRKRAPRPQDEQTFFAKRTANGQSPPEYVDPLSPTPPGATSDDEMWRAAIPKLHQQYVAIPERLPMGELIVRVRAAGTVGRDGRPPRLRVEAGITLGDGCSIAKRSLGEVDVRARREEPEIYEFRIRLEDVQTKGPLSEVDSFDQLSMFDMDQIFLSNISCDERAVFGLSRCARSDLLKGSAAIADEIAGMRDAGLNMLHLDSIEIEMLPGLGVNNADYRWTIHRPTESDDPAGLAANLLNRFMQAAYRRPIADEELARKLKLFQDLIAQQYSFEESLRETLAAVLVSPSFLFLEPTAGTLASAQVGETLPAYQTASRLSYLLWLSPPDEVLMKRAREGALTNSDGRRREAERLLADARSQRFLESFCRQWLRLDKHAHIAVDRTRYPTFDEDLAEMSIRETLEFFTHVVRSGGSALDLLDSDYAMINDRLARHYGIDGVTSGDFQRVQLRGDSPRGGLLTHASLLTMNSDGVDSHPVRRGVWLLERLLNDPPPPPPPQVPELDAQSPDLRGLSLKQRIELHREPSACQNCHRQIDPWGIAMEQFDATGQWRTRVTARGEDEQSQLVESASVLPDGHEISGAEDLKYYLRKQRAEQFASGLVHHLLTYTMGRAPRYSERREVERIEAQFEESGYRVDHLILAIVESELFLTRDDSITEQQSLSNQRNE